MASISEEQKLLQFIIDSGCSQHMVPSTTGLSNIRPYSVNIITASETSLTSTFIGTLHGKIGNINVSLNNVLVVPKLSDPLLSVKALTEEGASINFSSNGKFSITFANATSISSVKIGSVYRVFLITNQSHYALKTMSNDYETWHIRLGHASFEKIKKLIPQV
ncbi:hypothetical protein HMI56_006083, partial [Coelomomyces lativittatus]